MTMHFRITAIGETGINETTIIENRSINYAKNYAKAKYDIDGFRKRKDDGRFNSHHNHLDLERIYQAKGIYNGEPAIIEIGVIVPGQLDILIAELETIQEIYRMGKGYQSSLSRYYEGQV